MMTLYKSDFYEGRHSGTEYAASVVLKLVKSIYPNIKSAVDVGCGTGTWLSVCTSLGVDRIQGYDGPWVKKELLSIPIENFSAQQLEHEIPSSEKFDLVISLEVAEHLSESKSDQFVDQLTKLGDLVLFSAAVPGQGGVGHVNEQWPTYWIEKFANRGYSVADPIRCKIWDDEDIAVHYRQNILLFSRNAAEFQAGDICSEPMPLSVVHPRLLENVTRQEEKSIIEAAKGFKIAAIDLGSALFRRLARTFGRR